MKKINKLQINPQKLIKNDELVTLRGGTGGTCGYHCWLGQYDFSGCGYSYSEVQDILVWYQQDGYQCNWCCDHCSSTTYCGGY